MMSKYFVIFFMSFLAIGHCHYLYNRGYSRSTQLVWFNAEEPEDCKTAPEEVNTDELPKDMCDEASAKDRKCFCIGWNVTNWFGPDMQESSEDIKYFPWCGECEDPCALRFKWDSRFTVPKDDENEVEDEENGSGDEKEEEENN